MNPFVRKQPAYGDVDEFWRRTEQEIGESILARGLAEYHSGGEEEGPLWGLVYVTSTRLFFRHFPQANWLDSILSSNTTETGSTTAGPKGRDLTLSWTLQRYSHVVDHAERRSLRTLFFGRRAGQITIAPRKLVDSDVAADVTPLVLSVEHNRAAVVGALISVLQGTK